MKLLLIAVAILFLSSCTENTLARKFGGTSTVELESGQKLLNITWKENQLWTLTRNSRPGEPIETYEFKEHSAFGIIEGKVVVIEKAAMIP